MTTEDLERAALLAAEETRAANLRAEKAEASAALATRVGLETAEKLVETRDQLALAMAWGANPISASEELPQSLVKRGRRRPRFDLHAHRGVALALEADRHVRPE